LPACQHDRHARHGHRRCPCRHHRDDETRAARRSTCVARARFIAAGRIPVRQP
jgi:ferredoxin-thioredoxin reductase catalytic subunit